MSKPSSPGNLVPLLGPENLASSFVEHIPAYAITWQSFRDLLEFPHLESIISSQQKDETFRDLVEDAFSRLTSSQLVDVNIARGIRNYSHFLRNIDERLDPTVLSLASQAILGSLTLENKYISEANRNFFVGLCNQVEAVHSRASDVLDELAVLRSRIELKSQPIKLNPVQQTLHDILTKCYLLATDYSDILVPALSDGNLSILSGDFASLYDDAPRLDGFVRALRTLQTRLANLQSTCRVLSDSLANVVVVSKALSDGFYGLYTRTDAIEDAAKSLNGGDIESLRSTWMGIEEDVTIFIGTIEQTEYYHSSWKGAGSDPQGILRGFDRLFERLNATGTHQGQEFTLEAAALPPEPERKQILIRVLGAPPFASNRLSESSTFYNRILSSFDNLLLYQLLKEFSCIDPDDGSKVITIFDMVTIYRQKFKALAAEIMSVGRDIQAYSLCNVKLLPDVDANEGRLYPGDLLPNELITINVPLAEQYLSRADAIRSKFTQLKDNWNSSVSAIQKGINEASVHLNEIPVIINNQSKQAKLCSILENAGVFKPFAAAAFVADKGLLADLCATGSLGGLSVGEILQEHKLENAMNEGRAGVTRGRDIIIKLQIQLATMLDVDAHLLGLSGMWSEILSNDNPVDNIFYQILAGDAGHNLLINNRSTIISSWSNLYGAAKTFISNFKGI